MPITLTVVRGPHAGTVFTLDRHDTFLLGRSSDAHLSLPEDPYFSRHHLLIEANPPLCRLIDLGSINGTLVNGVRVMTAELSHGDEVVGGQTTLRVAVEAGPAASDQPTLPEPGPAAAPAIAGYRNPVEVARGGMGVVYRAVRVADGRAVAVKTIRPAASPDAAEVARFLREANVLVTLAHPRIIALHEAGDAGGVLYLVMEFVEGTDAARFVRSNGPLPVAEVVGLVGQLCEALGHAHGLGFVHRDVKPGNVLMVPAAGGGWDVKLADFGLAKAYQGTSMSGLTVSGAAGGTPAFMPPEQVTDFKSVRPAADQYGAAATAYYLLAGEAPFAGTSTADILRRLLAGSVERLDARRPEVPAAVADVIHRAMAVSPARRYPGVAAFAAALRDAAAGNARPAPLPDAPAEDVLRRFLLGNATPTEADAVEAWMAADPGAAALLGELTPVDPLWAAIQPPGRAPPPIPRVPPEPPAPPEPPPRPAPRMRAWVAAGIIAAVALVAWVVARSR